jgi:hippurate hydrolase
MKGGAKVLANDAAMAKAIEAPLKSLLGEKAVVKDAPRLMGSEDFHHLVLDNPGNRYLYMYVGTAKPEHFKKAQEEGKFVPYSNHNPDYQVDPDGIAVGTKVAAVSLLQFFRQSLTK